MTSMEFRIGEVVEVCSKEEGLVGSYYEAIVIKQQLGGDSYIVQYRTLLEEDESAPLREVVLSDDLRPLPPQLLWKRLSLNAKVDAFDNDGWWVGIVTGKRGNMCSVFFETTGEEIIYPVSKLRLHWDWIDGEWVSSRKPTYFF